MPCIGTLLATSNTRGSLNVDCAVMWIVMVQCRQAAEFLTSQMYDDADQHLHCRKHKKRLQNAACLRSQNVRLYHRFFASEIREHGSEMSEPSFWTDFLWPKPPSDMPTRMQGCHSGHTPTSSLVNRRGLGGCWSPSLRSCSILAQAEGDRHR